MEKELQKLLAKATQKKLPKKLRKKGILKILWPLITLILTALLERFNQSSNQKRPNEAKRKPVATPATQTRSRHEAVGGQNVSDSTLQAYIEKAVAYQAEIDRLASGTTRTSEQARLQELAARIDTWLAAIKELARRLDDFRQNKIVQQDITTVPKSISKVEAQLAEETDPTLRAELERTLANRQTQWTSLKNLQKSMRWAEIKIENTLSLLGTIHSQVLASQSKNHVADYRRFVDQVDEEVHGLQDHLEALDEVRLSRSM